MESRYVVENGVLQVRGYSELFSKEALEEIEAETRAAEEKEENQ